MESQTGVKHMWLVRDENRELVGAVEFDRPDTAAEFEQYENGDGGVTFEDELAYTVTLGCWEVPTRECTKPRCEADADAVYSNGPFQEPRCNAHAQGDHLTVVQEL